jgi:hypothetical protein
MAVVRQGMCQIITSVVAVVVARQMSGLVDLRWPIVQSLRPVVVVLAATASIESVAVVVAAAVAVTMAAAAVLARHIQDVLQAAEHNPVAAQGGQLQFRSMVPGTGTQAVLVAAAMEAVR